MLLNFLKTIIKLTLLYELLWQKSNLMALATQGKQNPLPCFGKYQIGFDNPADFDLVRGDLQSIEFNDFDKMPNETTLENNSNTVSIDLHYNDSAPTIKINFTAQLEVEGTFRLEFLYFQWFQQAAASLAYDNITFPGEFHLVFYNVKYKDFFKSINIEKSIVILAFGVQVNPFANQSFEVLQENLKYVQEQYIKHPITNYNLEYWIQTEMQRFYLYESSFLLFNCHGKVVWIDFEAPVSMTPDLIKEFQKLKNHDNKPLMESFLDFIKPKGKVFTNIPALPQLGNSPPLSFVYLEEESNLKSGSQMPELINVKQLIVLILFLNLF